jgi:hypothetical protein
MQARNTNYAVYEFKQPAVITASEKFAFLLLRRQHLKPAKAVVFLTQKHYAGVEGTAAI